MTVQSVTAKTISYKNSTAKILFQHNSSKNIKSLMSNFHNKLSVLNMVGKENFYNLDINMIR